MKEQLILVQAYSRSASEIFGRPVSLGKTLITIEQYNRSFSGKSDEFYKYIYDEKIGDAPKYRR